MLEFRPMRWSRLFIPTLRENPAEAEVPSHQLLLRAGYVRQLSAGIYSYLFLAQRSLLKIQQIVRQEMDAIGGQEMYLPALNPAEVWQESGRWNVMGDNLFRLKDRFGRDLCLAMTHEEVVTTIARGELRSYKQLPQIWYQIQTKFRDEPRPKSGLLRVRQFVMKDSYTFDMDQAGLDIAYDKHYQAYRRIFERCGLQYTVVEAHSGAMGGSQSHEFMVASDAGEDFVAICKGCGYSANLEKAAAVPCQPGVPDPDGDLTPEEFHTPGRKTIAEVSRVHRVARDVADEEPGAGGGRQTGAGDAARRPSTERDQIRREGGGCRVPPGAARRDPRLVRRRGRFARPGRRDDDDDPRRPGAGGPAQHDRRRQSQRLPPAPRDAGRGFSGGSLRPAAGCPGRWLRAVRRPARRGEDGGDRAHLQARLQVFRIDGAARAECRREGSDADHGLLRNRHRAHSVLRDRTVPR